jgi:sulfotransferase family protein
MERGYLLILGAPRSGTTLLATMVGRHSEIGLLNEDKGWAMKSVLGRRVVGNKRCVPNQIEMYRPKFYQMRFLKVLGLIDEYPSSQYSIIEYLALPNAKILGLIRDGNDVISSITNRSEKSQRVASYRWCRAVEVIHDLKRNYTDRVLVVSFEDIVLNPQRNMERVALFLGLEYEDRMLEGPAYNPWYDETALNTEKVNRSEKERIDFHLESEFPDAYRKYQELLSVSKIGVDEIRMV